MEQGRPLRFIAGVLGGWTALRVAMLWPADAPPPLQITARLPAATPAMALPAVFPPPSERHGRVARAPAAVRDRAGVRNRAAPDEAVADLDDDLAATALASGLAAAPVATAMDAPPPSFITSPVTPSLVAPERPGRSRLAIDSWLVLRPGGGDSLAFGQLGASQGGARLTYALGEDRRVALSARISAPTRGPGREAAIGVDLRPTPLPIHALVEERLGLDGGGARPAAGVIAGASWSLPARVRLDAYGQGGAVWRRGGFVDGAVMVARPVLERGGARLELGGGAWGAAQRGAARFDLGPSVALVAPVGGRAVRLQLDYRVRAAGRARPGSGPALTLGGSF